MSPVGGYEIRQAPDLIADAYGKMGVSSRWEAARMALQEGWITIEEVSTKVNTQGD